MNKGFLIFGAVAAGLAAWLLGRRNLGTKAKILLRKISYSGGLRSPKLNIEFVVQNPTNQSAKLSAVTGELYVSDKLIADFSSFGELQIKPRSQNTLKVTAVPSVGILSLLTSKNWLKKGTKYTIKGSANIDGLVVPLDYTTKLF